MSLEQPGFRPEETKEKKDPSQVKYEETLSRFSDFLQRKIETVLGSEPKVSEHCEALKQYAVGQKSVLFERELEAFQSTLDVMEFRGESMSNSPKTNTKNRALGLIEELLSQRGRLLPALQSGVFNAH